MVIKKSQTKRKTENSHEFAIFQTGFELLFFFNLKKGLEGGQ